MDDANLLLEAITHTSKVGDYKTRKKIEDMIKKTDEHIDWFETQLRGIKQAGSENYLRADEAIAVLSPCSLQARPEEGGIRV